jgi:hypothetical protein
VRLRAGGLALPEVGDPGVSVAVWRRGAMPALARLLDPLPPEALPHLRLEDVAAGEALDALRAAAGARSAALAPLLEDAAGLAAAYGRIAGRAHVRVRLERVVDDACSRFHADRVRLRLLCTYRGPGTEWLPEAAVRLDPDGGVAEPEPGEVRRLGRFEVGLLKGTRWPGSAPALHRSPPLAGTGLARLLLCVDEGDCGC